MQWSGTCECSEAQPMNVVMWNLRMHSSATYECGDVEPTNAAGTEPINAVKRNLRMQ